MLEAEKIVMSKTRHGSTSLGVVGEADSNPFIKQCTISSMVNPREEQEDSELLPQMVNFIVREGEKVSLVIFGQRTKGDRSRVSRGQRKRVFHVEA